MKNFLKLIVVILIILIFSYSTYGLFKSWQGNYFEHASFLFVILTIGTQITSQQPMQHKIILIS